MIYKLFLLSFVFFSMLINDNHSVQAQRRLSVRYCRTTGCDSRPRREVFDQCRRVYGSNVIRREPCDGGRFRYRCCTADPSCLNYPCVRQLFSEIREVCLKDYSASGFVPFDVNITSTGCAGHPGRFNHLCCPRF